MGKRGTVRARVPASLPIFVRQYRTQDWNAIAQVHDSARQQELALTVGIAAFRTLEDTAYDEDLFEGNLWVAEMEALVVGFVAVAHGEVTWLYVSPAHARRGVGRALVQHVIANGTGPLEVSVLEGNVPALELYKTEGFLVVEIRHGHLQGIKEIEACGHVLRRP